MQRASLPEGEFGCRGGYPSRSHAGNQSFLEEAPGKVVDDELIGHEDSPDEPGRGLTRRTSQRSKTALIRSYINPAVGLGSVWGLPEYADREADCWGQPRLEIFDLVFEERTKLGLQGLDDGGREAVGEAIDQSIERVGHGRRGN
jgi:hypothetical protein